MRQVRNPVGILPRFGEEQVSDEELEELIEFIDGLESDDDHQEPSDVSMEDVVAMHHWMAITALEADSITEAKHHVGHIIELVEDDEHRHQMEGVLAALESGDVHEAEHSIESMLAGVAEPELRLVELHLQMAIAAFVVPNAEDAQHHIHHYIELADTEKGKSALEALQHLEAGALDKTGELIMELLEGMPHQHHQNP